MAVSAPVFDKFAKVSPRQQKVQQLLARKDWKKAYKEARFAMKLSPSKELRQLLEYAIWMWLNDLVDKNLWSQAKEVARELLELDVASDDIRAEMPRLFARLDMNDRLPDQLKNDVDSPEMQVVFVDQYLLHSQIVKEFRDDYRQQADLVRNAFELIENREDQQASDALKTIPFSSPLADWRLFLRGLVDHYGKRFEDRDAAWKRLNPARPAAKIAACLREIETTPNSEASAKGGVTSKMQQIERLFSRFNPFRSKDTRQDAFVDSLSLRKDIEQIREHLLANRNKEMLGRFNAIKTNLENHAPDLLRRVRRMIWAHLVKRGEMNVLRQFVDTNRSSLPLDPDGNRTYALAVTFLDDGKNHPRWVETSKSYWLKFARNDIDQIETFSPTMKSRAKALVYNYVAGDLMDDFMREREPRPTCCPACIEEWEKAQRENQDHGEILKLLDLATEADPGFIDAHRHRVSVLRDTAADPSGIRDALKRLLGCVEDDIGALEELTNSYLVADEPLEATPYVQKIRALKPLGRQTTLLARRHLSGLVRHYLKLRQFDDARAALDRYDAIPYATLLHRFEVTASSLRFLLELLHPSEKTPSKGKSKKDSSSEVKSLYKRIFADRYEKELGPYLMILLEAGAVGMSDDPRIKTLREEWKKQVLGRCNGNAAGTLGDILIGTLPVEARYPDRHQYVQDAVNYILRAGSVKWKAEKDLLGACMLLMMQHETAGRDDSPRSMLQKLAAKYLKQFPKSPYGPFFKAESLVSRSFGPFSSGSPQKRMFLEQAKELLLGHENDPDYYLVLGSLPKSFAALDGGDPLSQLRDMLGGFDDGWNDDDEDDDEDDWDDDEDSPLPRGMFSGLIETARAADAMIPPILDDYRNDLGPRLLAAAMAGMDQGVAQRKVLQMAELKRKGAKRRELMDFMNKNFGGLE